MRAGQDMVCKVAVINIEADWEAYIQITGLRTWAHKDHPCPCCFANKDELQNMHVQTLSDIGHELYTDEAYQNDLQANFKEVLIESIADRTRLYHKFAYHKDYRGRYLRDQDIELGLPKFARLEPSIDLPDISWFEKLEVPFKATFFIASLRTRVIHKCCLFEIPGVTMQSWAIDLLHAWHLHGPIASYIGLSLHSLLKSGLLMNNTPGLDNEEQMRLALMHLKSHMWMYYKNKRADEHWKRTGTEVWNLSLCMLGKTQRPSLNAKAKETHGLLEFTVKMLEDHIGFTDNQPALKCVWVNLIEAGKAALMFDSIINTDSNVLNETEINDMFVSFQRFACLYANAGGETIPKFHLMFHLIQRSRVLGNPRKHMTYYHENVNGQIAKIALATEPLGQ